MKVHDVVPFPLGERRFLLNFWPVSGILEQFDPGKYCATSCEIIFADDQASPHDCIVLRNRKRNFANQLVDNVYVLVKTDFSAASLAVASYRFTHVGTEISEAQATAWMKGV